MAASTGITWGSLRVVPQTPRQFLILAWYLLIAASCLVLQAGAVENKAGRGLAAIPPLTARVTDSTGTLPAERRQALEAKLAAFEKDKGAQIAVLIVPTTEPEAIEQYSLRVVEAWKLGRTKVDDGLLLVVAKNDRRLRIEVGYGLEGAVPDAIAKRVISEVIAPKLAAGDFPGGIEAGVDALIKIVSGEPLPAVSAPQGAGGEGDLESLFVLVLVMALAVGQVLRAIFGRLFGSAAVGGVTGVLALMIAGSLGIALLTGLVAFVFSLLGLSPAMVGALGGGGFGGGSRGGGSGGFSGGGGSFGGGGASGGW